MLGALTGFAIIAVIIGVGYLVARLEVLPDGAGLVLNRTAFFVGSPALLFTVLARADLAVVFSPFLIASLVSAAIAALLFVLASRLLFRMRFGDTVIGATASGYVNANNIGLPVATYVIGSTEYIAPVLLFQLLIFAPVVLTMLDVTTRGRVSVKNVLLGPVRNPIVVGSALGVIVAATGIELPDAVFAPLDLIGGAAVPLMLLAFGMSLRGQRPFASGSPRRAVLVATVLKAVVMPAVAFVVARFLLHLPDAEVAAATVVAALPAAQNVNTYAVRYNQGVILARDAVLFSTVAAVPIILLVSLLLHPAG
ncbi:AEC family transporter [Schumannella sp. 10F1B-5-1]|uniref:AEC family transporter n=1 Tax=Schumannella sp. 10F1B-5-1 TaxID=2590780 RepID=UPI0011312DDD|nr:AEC family transporter [Schumannella sp. 10F1B-5-1]TPW76885.1 AEC family transporter [Schumannella sp. 10F1B-5-1]